MGMNGFGFLTKAAFMVSFRLQAIQKLSETRPVCMNAWIQGRKRGDATYTCHRMCHAGSIDVAAVVCG